MTAKDIIQAKALEILEHEPKGIRWNIFWKKVHTALPDQNPATVRGYLFELQRVRPKQVHKPSRGVFQLLKFRTTEVEPDVAEAEVAPDENVPQVKEQDFYKPFAEYLIAELDECTKAISLGGNKFKDRWGTPDVIGLRKPKPDDVQLNLPIEIVSVEIKFDSNAIITAFGQACSYKLFSHKSYLVVPNDAEELDRLDALCRIVGLGLILFDTKSPDEPAFEIRVRAAKHDPDMFYINRNVKLVAAELLG